MPPLAATVSRKIGRALGEYSMLADGDKVLVAVSGGKDSLVLLHYLVNKRKHLPVDYSLKALHLNTDVSPHGHWKEFTKAVAGLGVELDSIDVSVVSRLVPGRKMNCYWCSTQKRGELLAYALANGFTKIALGHHMDDILETFLMNMMYKSELSTMLPVFTYDKYPCTIIRPLALVTEREILQVAEELGYRGITDVCSCSGRTKRAEVKKSLDYLCREGDFVRDAIYKAMGNVKSRYLPN
ncbi:MAG: tRNA 2-thiocytidine biosynthesis protein TtcA [Spirochaetales bacterium]|nr:tRNA 2-thiocytidine biosynthesis protein TtcA [Spirochaetales bacterium]